MYEANRPGEPVRSQRLTCQVTKPQRKSRHSNGSQTNSSTSTCLTSKIPRKSPYSESSGHQSRDERIGRKPLERKYDCPVENCKAEFNRTDNLDRHIKYSQESQHKNVASAIKEKYCKECRRSFARVCTFSRHRNTKHADSNAMLKDLDGLSSKSEESKDGLHNTTCVRPLSPGSSSLDPVQAKDVSPRVWHPVNPYLFDAAPNDYPSYIPNTQANNPQIYIDAAFDNTPLYLNTAADNYQAYLNTVPDDTLSYLTTANNVLQPLFDAAPDDIPHPFNTETSGWSSLLQERRTI